MMYGTMTAMPNNPTPPLTPAASGGMVAPPGYIGAPGNGGGGPPSAMMDVKPSLNAQGTIFLLFYKTECALVLF